MVELDTGALDTLSSATLDDMQPSGSSTTKDAAKLLKQPIPRRTQSSEAKLPSSNVKRPLPVPRKSEALLQKSKALSLANNPLQPIARFPQSNVTNAGVPLSNNDDKTPIIIDNDADSSEDCSAGTNVIHNIDPHPDSKDGTNDAQDSSEQKVVVPKNFFDDVQS